MYKNKVFKICLLILSFVFSFFISNLVFNATYYVEELPVGINYLCNDNFNITYDESDDVYIYETIDLIKIKQSTKYYFFFYNYKYGHFSDCVITGWGENKGSLGVYSPSFSSDFTVITFSTWSDCYYITLKFTVSNASPDVINYDTVETNYLLSEGYVNIFSLEEDDLIYRSVDFYCAYFDSRGGEEVPTITFTATDKIFPHNAVSTNVENPIILPSTTREGFRFLGWSYSEEPNYFEYSSMDFICLTVDYDLYFYANWEDLRLNGDYKSNGYFILGKDGDEYLQSFSANVEFTSRNKLFSSMRFTFNDNGRYLYYDDLLVAYSNSESSGNVVWTSESYSNISFDNVYCDNNDFNLFIKYNFSLGSDDFVSFSGYYCFDEIVNYSNTLLIYSSFISNGNVYRKIFIDNGAIYYDKTSVYDTVNGWIDEKFRLVNFGGTSVLLDNYTLMLKYGDFGYISFNSTDNNVTDLLFSFVDIPVRIMSQLLDITVFGTTLFIAFCGILTVLICITVIKKFW